MRHSKIFPLNPEFPKGQKNTSNIYQKFFFAAILGGAVGTTATTADYFIDSDPSKETNVDKIQSLMKKRLKSDELELARLKNIPKIDQALQRISHVGLDLKQKVVVAQTLELCDLLKDSHYVISHAQANNGIIVNIVAKKTQELFESKKNQYFEVLRHNTFLKEIPKYKDVKWYQRDLAGRRTWDDDGLLTDLKTELISGDIHLESRRASESAIDFLRWGEKGNRMGRDQYLTYSIIQKILFEYFPDQEFASEASRKITDLTRKEKGGTLYCICIPKEKFDSCVYLSFPYAQSLTKEDFPKIFNYLPEVLEKWAISQQLNSWQKGGGDFDFYWRPPQVRILVSKLIPEENIYIIPHSTLSEDRMKEIEKEVEDYLLRLPKQWETYQWKKKIIKTVCDFFPFI